MNTQLNDPWHSFLRHPSEETFERLYAAALPLVYTICVRLTTTREDAEDACQAAFARIIRETRNGTHASTQDPKPLITRTAAREADALRKREARRAGREAVMEELPEFPAAAGEDRELRITVEFLVQSLPDELRLPIQLHYFHGFTQQEIADTLATPRTTIAGHLKKGMALLEEKLRQEGVTSASAVLTGIAGSAALMTPPIALARNAVSIWSGAAPSATMTAGGGFTAAAAGGITTYLSSKAAITLAALTLVATVLIVTVVNGSNSSRPDHFQH